jgi:hypothetical protein
MSLGTQIVETAIDGAEESQTLGKKLVEILGMRFFECIGCL